MLKTVRSTVNVDQITGVLPVVNGGTGVTTSTGTGSVVLSAAPTLSGNVGLSTGNIVPATASKGINFTANTPAAGMTSQLLNWYEEGTWTPTDASGAGLTLIASECRYTRIGRNVVLSGRIVYPATANATQTAIGGIPFTSAGHGTTSAVSNSAQAISIYISPGDTSIAIYGVALAACTNANMSSKLLNFSMSYFV